MGVTGAWGLVARAACLGLVLALALALAGCAAEPPAAAPALTEAELLESLTLDRPLTVRFWRLAGNDAAERLQAQVMAQFAGAYPTITADVRTFSSALTLTAQVLDAVRRGDPPEVVELEDHWLRTLDGAGAVVPLDSFVMSQTWGLEGEGLSDFVSGFLPAPWPRDGQQPARTLGLPFRRTVLALYVNRTLLGAAGVDAPATRWRDLPDQCARASRRAAAGCIAFPADAAVLTAMLYQAGLAADRLAEGWAWAEDPGVSAALDLLGALAAGRHAYTADPQRALSDFLDGAALYYLGPTSDLGRVREAFAQRGADWSVSPLPVVEGGSRATLLGGSSLAVLSRTSGEVGREELARRLAAWLLVRHLTSAEAVTAWGLDPTSGHPPVRRSVLEQPPVQQQLQGDPRFGEAVRAAQEDGRLEPAAPHWPGLAQGITDVLVQLGRRSIEAPEAQRRIGQLAQRLAG